MKKIATVTAIAILSMISSAEAAGTGDFAKAFETNCATKAARENAPMDCGCQVDIMKGELGETQANRLFEMTWLDHFAERNERNAARKQAVSAEMGGLESVQQILAAARKAEDECAK
ncbi:MAG: hypothetical protein Alpg2KO_24230 [Alphaproteobacteria bacterium]